MISDFTDKLYRRRWIYWYGNVSKKRVHIEETEYFHNIKISKKRLDVNVTKNFSSRTIKIIMKSLSYGVPILLIPIMRESARSV